MIDPAERYAGEAPTPVDASMVETLRFLWDEEMRRGYNTTDGLTGDDINVDPGHGAWSIGEILKLSLIHI